jgi:YHS domain-containing protein
MKNTILFILCFIGHFAFAQVPNLALIKKHYNIDKNSIALQGYDPVSYFTGKPQKGLAAITLQYNGVVYRFANIENKNKFNVSPAKYEPAYGGWCAYGFADRGEKIDVNAETYKIINGKLYLFYNAFFKNTLTKWNKDEVNCNKKADANWAKIYK